MPQTLRAVTTDVLRDIEMCPGARAVLGHALVNFSTVLTALSVVSDTGAGTGAGGAARRVGTTLAPRLDKLCLCSCGHTHPVQLCCISMYRYASSDETSDQS
jgi:hypothetical protein